MRWAAGPPSTVTVATQRSPQQRSARRTTSSTSPVRSPRSSARRSAGLKTRKRSPSGHGMAQSKAQVRRAVVSPVRAPRRKRSSSRSRPPSSRRRSLETQEEAWHAAASSSSSNRQSVTVAPRPPWVLGAVAKASAVFEKLKCEMAARQSALSEPSVDTLPPWAVPQAARATAPAVRPLLCNHLMLRCIGQSWRCMSRIQNSRAYDRFHRVM
mmetsp:Transcript_38910/g.98752  ORF Transcript_38910/g.98752 Transcript_38910/m.98752 type:complete len:212 (-) Transcript_38910:21-656(-)